MSSDFYNIGINCNCQSASSEVVLRFPYFAQKSARRGFGHRAWGGRDSTHPSPPETVSIGGRQRLACGHLSGMPCKRPRSGGTRDTGGANKQNRDHHFHRRAVGGERRSKDPRSRPPGLGSFRRSRLGVGSSKVSTIAVLFVCAACCANWVGEVGNLPRYGAKMVRNGTCARRRPSREDPPRRAKVLNCAIVRACRPGRFPAAIA